MVAFVDLNEKDILKLKMTLPNTPIKVDKGNGVMIARGYLDAKLKLRDFNGNLFYSKLSDFKGKILNMTYNFMKGVTIVAPVGVYCNELPYLLVESDENKSEVFNETYTYVQERYHNCTFYFKGNSLGSLDGTYIIALSSNGLNAIFYSYIGSDLMLSLYMNGKMTDCRILHLFEDDINPTTQNLMKYEKAVDLLNKMNS